MGDSKKRLIIVVGVLALLGYVLLTCAAVVSQETSLFIGEWSGAISLPGQKLDISVTIDWEDNEFQGNIDIPLQGAFGIPLQSFVVEGREISFSLAGIPGDPELEMVLAEDDQQLEGFFHQSGASFPATLTKKPLEEKEAEYKESALEQEEQREMITASVKRLLKELDVPGAAVGVVKDGEVFLAEGFGYADLETETRVSSDTLFAIGSSTKAFTTAAVALMVDEGELSWDRPVVEYLPWFRMDQDYATLHVTLRDFALHRSGLARHDFSWYSREIGREEIIESVQYLELGAHLRETFIYNNHGYTILGYLAGLAAEMDWEEMITEYFLLPLGMESTNMTFEELKQAANHARPYQLQQQEILPMAYRDLNAIGPAGSINSTVEDMLAWVQLFLNDGRHGEEQILSPSSIAELTRPQMALPAGGFQELRFSNYALGWMVDDYRGELVVHHGGNIDGYTALVAMVPQKQLGIVVLTNQNNSSMPTLTVYDIIDIMMGREQIDWSGRMQMSLSMMPEELIQPPRQIQATEPSRDLKEYAGYYEHPGYGQVQVAWIEEDQSLEFTYLGQTTILEHWHYDVFTARILGMAIGMNLPVHFVSDVSGYIESLTLPLDVSVPAIEFSLVAGPELREASYLESFAGEYNLMGLEITIRAQEEQLVMDLPGQPSLVLLPQRRGHFIMEGLQGYSVDFYEEDGEVRGLWLNQPNGSFQAERI